MTPRRPAARTGTIANLPGVSRVENEPPRDPGDPEPPARSRHAALEAESQTEPPTPQTSPDAVRRGPGVVLGLLWLLAVFAATGGLIALRATDARELPQQAVAVALGTLFALGLSARSGGRPLAAALLALLVGGAAIATQWEVLLAGAAVGTGVLAACLAVLGTTPAPRFRYVVREVVLAQSLATAGAIGVAGFAAELDPAKFAYTVLALSLAATTAMIYRLGGGLHGLGRTGVVVAVVALVVLAVSLAYSEALARYGDTDLTARVDELRFGLRDAIGAVPHPIEVLLGLPALAWGVFLRAHRRQGWWVCAFGAAATAPATTRLIDVGVTPLNTFLAAVYSIVLGLVLGYLLIRAEQAWRGTRGRRARRVAGSTVHRPEPERLRPLH